MVQNQNSSEFHLGHCVETNFVRILWINHIFIDTDVYSTFPMQLIYSLRKRGHEVHLVVPSLTKRSQWSIEDTKLLPTIHLPVLYSLSFFFALLFYIPKAIKSYRPNAIIGNFYEYPGLIIAKLFRNVKLVLDVRASIGGKSGISAIIEKILYFTALKFAKNTSDGITVASRALREEICAYGIDRTKVKVITNGVSLDLFDYRRNSLLSAKLRDEFSLSKNFVIMYHGSLGSFRGLTQTIEAIAIIKSKHPDIVFFILGKATKTYEEELKKLIEEKSLADNVFIHEAVSHELVPKFLAMCDIGIVPLAVYSFPLSSCPLKLIEYLAMAKPVISTDIPFSREVIELCNCGILIPSYEPEHIVAGIEYMYERRSSLDQMGRLGRAIVEKHYSWTEKSKDIESFVKELSE